MQTVRLIVRRDKETDDLGLMLKAVRQRNFQMVALEGRLIAHDILEHQNGSQAIGSVDDELEALGGLWFVRGQFGLLAPNDRYAPQTAVSNDIAYLGEFYARGVPFRTPVPTDDEIGSQDDELQYCVELAKPILMREMECSVDMQEEESEEIADEFCGAALHYLRAGYAKAARRFSSGDQALHDFWMIAETVDCWLRKDLWIEGMELDLHWGITESGEQRAYVEEVEEYGY